MKTKYAVLGTVTLMVASVGLWVGQPHAQTQSPVVTRTSRFQPPAPTDNLLAHALMQRRAQQQATKQAVSVQLANKNAATQAHGQGNAKTVPAGQIHGATTSTKNVSSSSQTTASGATSPTAGTTTAAKPATSTPAPSATRAPAQHAPTPAPTPRAAGPRISFLGITMPVLQGSMSATTAPAGNYVETWGGQTRLSVSDGQSTHIIGHNTSNFGAIIQLGVGSAVTVTDVNGQVRTYHVTSTADVNDQGYDVHTGRDEWNHIVSASQGEQIVLQTCLSGTVNRMVWAR
ncbi:sortase domain-bontaining protein [Lacticaseibacillus thailandensis]|nr:sortase [Lacticaseibacillus thailandensis]